MLEMRLPFLGREDPLEKEMVTPSSILAWRSSWIEEPGRLQSMGLKRVGHELASNSNKNLALRRPILRAKAAKFVITEQVNDDKETIEDVVSL